MGVAPGNDDPDLIVAGDGIGLERDGEILADVLVPVHAATPHAHAGEGGAANVHAQDGSAAWAWLAHHLVLDGKPRWAGPLLDVEALASQRVHVGRCDAWCEAGRLMPWAASSTTTASW